MLFTKEFIQKNLPSAEIYGEISTLPNVYINSLSCTKDSIFFAIRGEVQDGHDYIKNAIDNGASVVFINKKNSKILSEILPNVKSVVAVSDTKKALYILAKAWKKQFTVKTVGITGSMGKTTTKEILKNILYSAGIKYLASPGNYNTLIGLSLTFFSLRQDHKILLAEMGISKKTEMSELADFVEPDTAVITAVGNSHLEGLGEIEDVASEKRKIFKNFPEKSIGAVNGDYTELNFMAYNHPVIRFGKRLFNQIQARKIKNSISGISFTLSIYKKKYEIYLENSNFSIVPNILAAVSVAKILNIKEESILSGIKIPLDIKGRFQLKYLENNKIIIDDCYNANPESMRSSLESFNALKTSHKKICILGNMNELGIDYYFYHRQILKYSLRSKQIDKIIIVGDNYLLDKKILDNEKIVIVTDWKKAQELIYLNKEPEIYLIKGSTKGYTQGLAELVKSLKFSENKNKESNI